jgi:hypothetical protein
MQISQAETKSAEIHRRLLSSDGGGQLRVRRANVRSNRGRQDPAVWKRAEESLPARITAVSRKSEPAFDGEKRALLHALTRYRLQIKISAFGAVGIAHKPERNAARIKPPVARMASPGFQPGELRNDIERSIAMRTEAIATAALRANHFPGFPLFSRAAY